MDERGARVALRISIHDVHLTTDNEAHDATFRAHRLIRTGGIVPHRKIGRRASRTTDAEADESEGSRGDEREEEELDVVVHARIIPCPKGLCKGKGENSFDPKSLSHAYL